MHREISTEEVKEIVDKMKKQKSGGSSEVLILDVREYEDYKKEHIPNAVHMYISDFEEKAAKIDRKTKIITYSRDISCPASTIAAKKLSELGFENVFDYKESFKAWKEAGYETARESE